MSFKLTPNRVINVVRQTRFTLGTSEERRKDRFYWESARNYLGCGIFEQAIAEKRRLPAP